MYGLYLEIQVDTILLFLLFLLLFVFFSYCLFVFFSIVHERRGDEEEERREVRYFTHRLPLLLRQSVGMLLLIYLYIFILINLPLYCLLISFRWMRMVTSYLFSLLSFLVIAVSGSNFSFPSASPWYQVFTNTNNI